MSISVCIATYRRLDRLVALLEDLSRQQLLPDEVTIVDNDASGSARDVVDRFRLTQPPFTINYDIQPVKNISLTRNRTVELTKHEWLAFIDDDERAPQDWLGQLAGATDKYLADGALGPVEPLVPEDAPA
jgi:succinoglycan biosynthesis protein ExoM